MVYCPRPNPFSLSKQSVPFSLNVSAATITPDRFPNSEQLMRQQHIISLSSEYIAKTLATGSTTYAALNAYALSTSPLVLENVEDAAVAQIDLMVEVMGRWRSSVLTPDEWAGLRFVASSSHMAVHRNLVSQVWK